MGASPLPGKKCRVPPWCNTHNTRPSCCQGIYPHLPRHSSDLLGWPRAAWLNYSRPFLFSQKEKFPPRLRCPQSSHIWAPGAVQTVSSGPEPMNRPFYWEFGRKEAKCSIAAYSHCVFEAWSASISLSWRRQWGVNKLLYCSLRWGLPNANQMDGLKPERKSVTQRCVNTPLFLSRVSD